jgi:hypothetical protein
LIRPGRNDEAQTTKGWPDAFVAIGKDEADAIEATRDRTNWEQHLEEDLQKAQSRVGRKLVGYLFLGGYPDNNPSSTVIEAWVRKFSALGIPHEKITILVGKELAFELAAPEYARIRQDLLDIPSSPSSFLLLTPGLLGNDRLGAFQPSKEDFEKNRVWPPPLAETVVDRLVEKQCALVRGHGAVGKTTLAQLLATDPRVAPFPVYYLDLNKLVLANDGGGGAKNDLIQFGGSNVVFVIDNVHLDELLAQALIQHWQVFAKQGGGRLLLLGREIAKRMGSPLGGVDALVLRAGHDEMRGVIVRMFGRQSRQVPGFSDSQVDAWVRVFGGDPDQPDVTVDLIAFGAAVEKRLSSLGSGDHRLAPSDAVEAIRTHYLHKIPTSEERQNLFRLAVLAQLELPLSAESLPHPSTGFEAANKLLGLVLTDRVGRDSRTFYQLAHPALGQLLIEAFGRDHDPAVERVAAARQDVSLGIRIHDRLRHTKEQSVIAAVLVHEFLHSDWPATINSLNALMNSMRRALRQRFTTAEAIDHQIAESSVLPRLYLSERSLPAITDFNSRASVFPKTMAAVSHVYDTSGAISVLCDTLYVSHVTEVASFLRSHPAREALVQALDCDRWNEAQQQVAVGTQFPPQTIFALRYLEQNGRPDLVGVPGLLLLRHSTAQLWVEQGANSNLDHVSHLLRMCAAAPASVKRVFLDQIVTPKWVALRYMRNRLGILSGTLFSLSNHLEVELRGYFESQTLWDRVRKELNDNRLLETKKAARAMCLLGGCVALFGRAPDLTDFVWPDVKRLEGMINVYAGKADANGVGTHELQLWLGLRAMMEMRNTPVQITAAKGERFFGLLGKSAAPTKLGASTNAELMAWLRQCRATGWQLGPSDRTG